MDDQATRPGGEDLDRSTDPARRGGDVTGYFGSDHVVGRPEGSDLASTTGEPDELEAPVEESAERMSRPGPEAEGHGMPYDPIDREGNPEGLPGVPRDALPGD